MMQKRKIKLVLILSAEISETEENYVISFPDFSEAKEINSQISFDIQEVGFL